MIARRGLGLITSSNFYVPQVNLPGNMASFVTPAGIPIVSVSGSALHGLPRAGLGQSLTFWEGQAPRRSWTPSLSITPLGLSAEF
jgi:hypothetical protein